MACFNWGINEPVRIVRKAQNSGLREILLHKIFKQMNPARAAFVSQFRRDFACPCEFRMGPKSMDRDDPCQETLVGPAHDLKGYKFLLELGTFWVRKDLNSVGATLLRATANLGNDGIQQHGE